MNIIKSKKPCNISRCPSVSGRRRIAGELSAYLTDESRTEADNVDVVFFPENTGQLCDAVMQCSEKEMNVSIAGARTGIVGGSVPIESDAVISMERMNQVGPLDFDEDAEKFKIKTGAGVVLSQLQEALANTRARDLPWKDLSSGKKGLERIQNSFARLFYPVDPTEVSAQIGGTVATNASGARSLFYGSTREWIEALVVIAPNGELIELKRGHCFAEAGSFVWKRADGSDDILRIPDVSRPLTKNTAGYFLDPENMDAIDLFIGSEGTLGVIAEVELKLTFEPPERLFATVFLEDEADAIQMVEKIRKLDDLVPLALEYTGPGCLSLLRKQRSESGSSSNVPPLPPGAGCALYIETAFEKDPGFLNCFNLLKQCIDEAGSSSEKTWAGVSGSDMLAMKSFRHAVPEAVNTIIAERKRSDPTIHKIGTDMAVPHSMLRPVMKLYRESLASCGLQHVIFGHIGENHLHVNIIPESGSDMEPALELYDHLAAEVAAMGGCVSAEHGIGRLKKRLLRVQYTICELEGMEAIKRVFDPKGLFNAGVIF